MAARVIVAGVGMIPFVKPGASDPYPVMAAQATHLALDDAGVDYRQIQQAYVGYVYGDSTCGQRVLYEIGMTGIPIFNVNNNCSTGSTALFLARQAVESGAIDCALALGFEQMAPGALNYVFNDRPAPLEHFTDEAARASGGTQGPMAIQLFGSAGLEYQERYGARNETFAKISEKARRHARDNARAIFRQPVTVDEVLASPVVFGTHDPAPVLPAHLRRGGGGRLLGGLCSPPRPAARRGHRGPGADHGFPLHLRRARHDEGRRL